MGGRPCCTAFVTSSDATSTASSGSRHEVSALATMRRATPGAVVSGGRVQLPAGSMVKVYPTTPNFNHQAPIGKVGGSWLTVNVSPPGHCLGMLRFTDESASRGRRIGCLHLTPDTPHACGGADSIDESAPTFTRMFGLAGGAIWCVVERFTGQIGPGARYHFSTRFAVAL